MNAVTIAIALVVGIVIGVDIAYFFQRRSRLLRKRFGPEYSLAVAETGDRWKANSGLSAAQKGQSAFTSTLSLLQNTAAFWKLGVRFKADL